MWVFYVSCRDDNVVSLSINIDRMTEYAIENIGEGKRRNQRKVVGFSVLVAFVLKT